jgi:TonB family protein
MVSLSGGVSQSMRSPWSYMGSVCLHAWILAWVALAPAIPLARPKSLYQREIQPNQKRIVWYKLSDRLPDVTPPEARRDKRPLRARSKFDQNIAAGRRDDLRPPQLIWAPAPEITPPKALPLPNIVAVAPQLPPRRRFIAPPVLERAPDHSPVLPDAPRVPRRFTPPRDPPTDPKLALPAPLPPAPEVAANAPNLAEAVTLPRQQRKFVAPPKQPAAPAAPPTIATAPPSLTANAALSAENTLAIAGLNPVVSVEVPAPPGSVKAAFSAGPTPQHDGGEGTPAGALLEIPSLTVQGGAAKPQPPLMVARVSPTSPQALAAAVRLAHDTAPAGGAVRAASLPDPRMHGRQVYIMAVQIPNLTSYSGSWLVWFAGREPDIANPDVDMRAPLPLHMVSPKYINSAVEERVEGKVKLWAVIGRDGRVGDISLLQHLDERLDRSAEEALGKWLFQPAVRNGVAVDVDAVFEIPFTLAPKTIR